MASWLVLTSPRATLNVRDVPKTLRRPLLTNRSGLAAFSDGFVVRVFDFHGVLVDLDFTSGYAEYQSCP